MKKQNTNNLVIVGGGIMGLFTAYYASQTCDDIIIVEKSTIGNKFAASSGYSRSIRNDYLDPFYSCLASQAQKMWRELEKESGKEMFIKCSVLNIAKTVVTPILDETYASKSYAILKKLGFATKLFKNKIELQANYSQFNANLGCVDIDAGMLYIPNIIEYLKQVLIDRGVQILENSEVTEILPSESQTILKINSGKEIIADKLVITTGAWSIDILNKIKGNLFKTMLPIVPIKQKLEYFEIPAAQQKEFSSENMPVFAYLDAGIYGHPIYGDSPGLKVAYFDPLGAKLVKSSFNPQKQSIIKNNIDFIRECLPSIKDIKICKEENNYYDMTPDNNFIIDRLPGYKNIFIGAGFCGTGFKFAPLIGEILADLSLKGSTIINISRFNAKRFIGINNLKIISVYLRFFYPRNWGYLKTGVLAILNKIKLYE